MPLQRLVLSFYAYKQRILLPAVKVYGNYILIALKVLNVDGTVQQCLYQVMLFITTYFAAQLLWHFEGLHKNA